MTDAPHPTLAQLRAEVDACNATLVEALDRRARLVRAIAAWKRAHGVPLFDAAREDAVLDGLAGAADGLGRDGLRRVFLAVLEESRRVAADGP